VLTNFEFAGSTGYLPLQADVDHLVEILPAGTSTVAISATVNLSHTKGYAAIATGGANGWDLGLVLLENDTAAPAAENFKLRLGHLAPFAAAEPDTEADVRLQDGTPVLEGVTFGQIADYLELAAGTYDLKVTTPGGATTLIDPLPVPLSDGDILSAFAIGDGTNQPTAVFALPAGKPGFILPDKYMLYLPFIARAD
jgi:hypothetical protein